MINTAEEKKPWKWLAVHLNTDDEKKQIDALLTDDNLCLEFFRRHARRCTMYEKDYKILLQIGHKEIFSECISILAGKGHYLATDILDFSNEYVYYTCETDDFFRDFLRANGPKLSQECKLHPERSVKDIAWKVIRECTDLDTIPGTVIKFDKYIYYYKRVLFDFVDDDDDQPSREFMKV